MVHSRTNWRLYFSIATLVVFATVAATFAGLIIALTLSLVLAWLLAFWLSHRTARSLAEIQAATDRIMGGDFQTKIYAVNEFAPLSRKFNEMTAQLADRFGQLSAEGQQLRMTLAGMVEGVIAIDAEERIIFANERAGFLLELPRQVAGCKLWEVVRQRKLLDLVQRALAEPNPCQEELLLMGVPAQSLTVHAARLPGTPPAGAVMVLHDTSELRRLERMRQEFVANVSHELKTPLSIISACVETLQAGAIDDAEHREGFLERIAEQSERLHALILDLLSLARIESGAELFEEHPVPVGEIVTACVDRHRGRAESLELWLDAESEEFATGDCAMADEEALQQILDNLVDNALKYTPAGGRVTVKWRIEGELVRIDVQDTGLGIPEADLPRVFERFYRVDKARSRELGGTGLGLAIVKHLVQTMGGSVSATSRLNHGTTFTVRLPRSTAAEPSPTLHGSAIGGR